MANVIAGSPSTNATARSNELQGYQLLHWAFVIVPVIAGLDKFAHLLTNWDAYLAPAFARILGGASHGFMLLVGIVEIIAGLIVALRPRVGAYIVAAWLALVVVNLIVSGHHFDIALRDIGLLLGALALGRLAATHDVRDRNVTARTRA
ncbi:hypothetical protein AKJ09_10615 [Labilithrix luteola]|uniref:Transmembrane protein n=1 Tax=Labilithrix luteola TaxID=1391654 RepID=A0A0K1QE59_9BACT|nr:hypothetical protein [Labilithrix luteola]AKV03952.1 hypothetical protein AKJ09_10615 [Labilithrix luteola]